LKAEGEKLKNVNLKENLEKAKADLNMKGEDLEGPMWFTPNESSYLFKPEHEKIIKIYKEAHKEFKTG